MRPARSFMKILALDAALARCSVALWQSGTVLAGRTVAAGRGHAALLPVLVAEIYAAAGHSADGLDAVAVTVGPGSFTGLRAAVSLAQGLAAGAGARLVGVTVAEAMAEAVPPCGRAVWVAIDSRRDRVFLSRHGVVAAFAVDALPPTGGPVVVVGDAAVAVACRLAARGDNVMLGDGRVPDIGCVAAVAARRLAGALAEVPVQPLYIDPPEAKLPAGGLRPAPR